MWIAYHIPANTHLKTTLARDGYYFRKDAFCIENTLFKMFVLCHNVFLKCSLNESYKCHLSKISSCTKNCCMWHSVTFVDILSELHSQETCGGGISLHLSFLGSCIIYQWKSSSPDNIKRRISTAGIKAGASRINYAVFNIIATGYGLDGLGLVPGRDKKLFSTQRWDRLWCPPSLLSSGYRWVFPRGKSAGAWSWQLTSIQCRVQERWSYTSTPQYVFMA
jgi:hypothetical protein